ncbi:putative polyol transporter 1 [Mycena venus]|uniref:Putative polyol transporter 1 n=1 Tax=Mycena venus TaxID=2733690 RepID=A0A8H6YIY4_9AGAR|nr:putative polyol transporter 1 [Mycena venus]
MSSEKVDQEKRADSFEEQRQIDLVNNANARIQNPLHGIPHDRLLAQVEEFVREKGFDDQLALFQKAALLAQNPSKFESIPELDEEDKAIIRREVTHKWDQPRALYLTVILCSIGAAVQGCVIFIVPNVARGIDAPVNQYSWDQTGSNGANLSFPVEFGIDDSGTGPTAERNQWIVGVINSAPYIAAAIIGCWLTDPLNHYLGRRGAIFVCAIFCTLPVIGSGLAQTWPQLFVCRVLLGLGMGPKASTVPVFAAENVPASIRGGLVMCWQMWVAFGIFLGTTANLVLFQVGFYCLAAPTWLGLYSCDSSADRCLLLPGVSANSELQAARDLFYVHRQLMEEFAILKGSTYIGRFIELFTIPRVRRASLAAWVVMIAQQMCGINIIAFYSSSIFVAANYSVKSSLLASWGFGLVNFLFAFPAVWTIDTFGRRNLLLFTFPNMAWSLLAAGLCFLIPGSSGARIPLIALFIFIFAAFYSPGEGPVPFTYSAEVFPLTHREMGMSFAVATNLFFASVLGLTFPRILHAFTPVGAFGFYAGLNVLAFVMIFLLLPETKQRTLEELDHVFAVPTSKHVAYQVHTFLPYFFKRWILFNKNAELKPLYNFEEVESITVFEKGAGH